MKGKVPQKILKRKKNHQVSQEILLVNDVFGPLPATMGDRLNQPEMTTKPKMMTKISQAEDREREA